MRQRCTTYRGPGREHHRDLVQPACARVTHALEGRDGAHGHLARVRARGEGEADVPDEVRRAEERGEVRDREALVHAERAQLLVRRDVVRVHEPARGPDEEQRRGQRYRERRDRFPRRGQMCGRG